MAVFLQATSASDAATVAKTIVLNVFIVLYLIILLELTIGCFNNKMLHF